MDRGRFDELSIAVAAGQTRRTVLGRVFGGSFAALLAAVGSGASDDEAAAKSRCAKKCNKKHSHKKRSKCHKHCQAGGNLAQQGSATLTSQSDPDCATAEGICVDAVDGAITGTPIAVGTFAGDLTGTNFRPGSDPGTFAADYSGTLTATETATGDTLIEAVELTLTQDQTTGDFDFSGTYEISGGTGRFAGATGNGTVSGSGNRALDGQSGTVDEFSMNGTIDLS
jgi:hypothetical protein